MGVERRNVICCDRSEKEEKLTMQHSAEPTSVSE